MKPTPERTGTDGAEPPVETKGTRFGRRSRYAAGLKAVTESLGITAAEMGPVRGMRALLALNQKDGFDCQSCAWPSPDEDRSAFEFCENGAKALADEGMEARAGPEFFAKHSVRDLAGRSDHWLGKQGRLTAPMVLRPGATHYGPIGWDEAFALIAAELKALASPNEATFYTSGRTSNEAAFLYQLFARAYGTNNLPDCSNMCHESSGSALTPTIGIGKGCVTLDDFEKADAIFILGQNPGTNHPRMLTALQKAKKRGCRIVSINPMPEVGSLRFVNPQDFMNPLKAPGALLGHATEISDLWLQARINSDMEVMQGIMKVFLEEEDRSPGTILDTAFIAEFTEGFQELSAHLRATSWESITRGSGLSREQIREAAAVAMGAKAIIACWAMGLTQHRNSVATIQEVLNFLLIRGNIGRPGAGPCPVRGHSNVQGDRTMGIWEKPGKAFLDKLAAEFSFEPPREHGVDVVDSIKAMHEGRVKVLFALGGNFLSSTPDTEYTARALRRCTLTAHVSTKLNRAHLVTGETALILPCLGRSEADLQESGEQFVTVEDSMGIINPSRGRMRPASELLRSEPAIVAGLARATLGDRRPADWAALAGNYDLIRDHIERVVPGVENFNERIKKGIFYLPNAARDKRVFQTPSGRAVFTVHFIPEPDMRPGELLMMTIRSHDQFNTTVYGLDDRYRGIFNGRRVIFMNPDDAADRGLVQGQLVDLASHYAGVERRAPRFMVAPYSMPRGCAATYFPEANVLVPIESVALVSNTPTSKSVKITVTASAVQEPAEVIVPLPAAVPVT
jgi:molybdopterin-dependent oxidoreductase alpha subunit